MTAIIEERIAKRTQAGKNILVVSILLLAIRVS
jgi:hypothetical protein